MGNESSRKPEEDMAARAVHSEYRLGSSLGKGSFGQVFKVTKISDPCTTGAVKIMRKVDNKKRRQEEYWDVTNIFNREVAVLMRLEHINILKYWDSFDHGSHMYLVTELCMGAPIFDQICCVKSFHENDASSIAVQILLALEYIHHRKVMHRDIKAENFMFSEPSLHSAVKMIDFGMSCSFDEGEVFHMICGSRFYVAPEMIQKKYDHRIDIWAFGVLTYLLCCGQYPFKANSTDNKKRCADFHAPLEFRESVPLSPETKDFIRQILVHSPDQRLTAEGALAHPFIGYTEDDSRPSRPSVVSQGSQSWNRQVSQESLNWKRQVSQASLNSNLSGAVRRAREEISLMGDGAIISAVEKGKEIVVITAPEKGTQPYASINKFAGRFSSKFLRTPMQEGAPGSPRSSKGSSGSHALTGHNFDRPMPSPTPSEQSADWSGVVSGSRGSSSSRQGSTSPCSHARDTSTTDKRSVLARVISPLVSGGSSLKVAPVVDGDAPPAVQAQVKVRTPQKLSPIKVGSNEALDLPASPENSAGGDVAGSSPRSSRGDVAGSSPRSSLHGDGLPRRLPPLFGNTSRDRRA